MIDFFESTRKDWGKCKLCDMPLPEYLWKKHLELRHKINLNKVCVPKKSKLRKKK